jgi:hypothetical protein
MTDPAAADLLDDALEEELASLASRIAAAESRFCALLAEVDRRGLWALAGASSCAAWLSWRCGLTAGAARERVRVANALRALPLLGSAFAAGRLSFSQVRALTRVATPESEGIWVEWAGHTPASQIERVCTARRRVRRLNQPDADRRTEEVARTDVVMSTDEDGMVTIRARLHPEDAHLVVAALQARVMADPCDEPIGERRAEALVDMARSGLVAGSRQVEDTPGVNAYELLVHLDAASLDGDTAGCAAIDGGPLLSTATAQRLACDTAVAPLRMGAGQPLDVGRSRRTIPPAIRRAVTARDRHCTFPGCGRTRGLQCHHVVFWGNGGVTAVQNLVLVCRRHHRAVHEEGFSVELTGEGETRWCHTDGSVLNHVPAPKPVTCPLRADRERDGWVLTPEWQGHLLDRATLNAALEHLDRLDRLDRLDVSAETPIG